MVKFNNQAKNAVAKSNGSSDSLKFTIKNDSARTSVFARLGDVASDNVSGTPVLFENLPTSVVLSDVVELCESLGEVNQSSFKNHVAEVVFARASVAQTCVERYNGVKLDGKEMVVKLKGSQGKENPLNAPLTSRVKGSNVRVGLFGTAMEDTTSPEGRSIYADSGDEKNIVIRRVFKNNNSRSSSTSIPSFIQHDSRTSSTLGLGNKNTREVRNRNRNHGRNNNQNHGKNNRKGNNRSQESMSVDDLDKELLAMRN